MAAWAPVSRQNPALLLGAGGRQHARVAQRTCDLDRRHADAAGAALHQHGLAMVEAAQPDHAVPRGEERLRQGGGLDEIEALRDRHALHRGHAAELGIAAAIGQRTDGFARPRPVHVRRNAVDDARHVEPEHHGRAGRRRVEPAPLLHVGPVHGGGGDPDQHLAGSRRGYRALDQAQHLWAAGRADMNRFHLDRFHGAGGSTGEGECRHCNPAGIGYSSALQHQPGLRREVEARRGEDVDQPGALVADIAARMHDLGGMTITDGLAISRCSSGRHSDMSGVQG